jgi:hypothetical protein
MGCKSSILGVQDKNKNSITKYKIKRLRLCHMQAFFTLTPSINISWTLDKKNNSRTHTYSIFIILQYFSFSFVCINQKQIFTTWPKIIIFTITHNRCFFPDTNEKIHLSPLYIIGHVPISTMLNFKYEWLCPTSIRNGENAGYIYKIGDSYTWSFKVLGGDVASKF